MMEPRTNLTTQLILRFLYESEIQPNTVMEIGSSGTLGELVRLNVAVGVLPPWTFDRELTSGTVRLRPLGSKTLHRRWVFLHRAQRRLTMPEEEFIKICRRRAAAIRLGRRDLPRAETTVESSSE